MKGDRGREQHDTPLTRCGDQLVNVSGVDYIAMRALRHREEQEAKAQQKRLSEIRNIARKLRQCCRQPEFRWPDENDLERLHVLVSELVRRIRKRPLLPQWKRYKAVDDHWHLRLWLTLSDLLDRAAKNTPQRPLEDYDQRLTTPALNEATKKFFKCYSEVAKGQAPSQIKWEQFDELFSSVMGRTISRRIPLTQAKSNTYLAFLELFCADQQWTRTHWKGAFALTHWIATNLQHPQMLRKLTRFLIPAHYGSRLIERTEQLPQRFAEEKRRAERARDRARKRHTE